MLSDANPLFVWKITNFSKILKEVKTMINGRIESDPFYTERYGYKLKVQVNPNDNLWFAGWPWNTHLSVYIIVMPREYDAILPWPFDRKATLTLTDQKEDPTKRENVVDCLVPDRCRERPKGKENLVGVKLHFTSHLKLQTRCYLVDDTLFLQVHIGPP